MNREPLEVLIVEDNPGDTMIISELLEDVGLPVHVTIAKDGQEALDLLRENDGGSTGPPPALIILDLNLPKVKGFDVLRHIKSTPMLRSIPVVVMTGSLRKEDEVKARTMGAADYCIKPATPDEMGRSADCLRGRLKLLQKSERSSGSGPSAAINSDTLQSCFGKQHAPPPRNERFIMDIFNEQSWNMWK
jgi:CheY-like chemotaxis protein